MIANVFAKLLPVAEDPHLATRVLPSHRRLRMNTGFYSAYAAFAARMDQLDIVANNLANANTSGFKAIHGFYRSFAASLAPEPPEPAMITVSQAVQKASRQFGLLAGTHLDLSAGNSELTGNDTDAALEGPGFFAVQTKNGVRFTRDGGFRINSNRNLVTLQGDPVLDQRSLPIQLPSGSPTISPDGSVSVNGALVSRLRIEEFAPGTPLIKEGDNYISAPAGAGKPAVNTNVRQGSLEASNSDPVRSAVALIDVQRTAQMMEKALAIFHNEFNRSAAQDLPRV
jgi:flagellar basal-body rod protein FlgF